MPNGKFEGPVTVVVDPSSGMQRRWRRVIQLLEVAPAASTKTRQIPLHIKEKKPSLTTRRRWCDTQVYYKCLRLLPSYTAIVAVFSASNVEFLHIFDNRIRNCRDF